MSLIRFVFFAEGNLPFCLIKSREEGIGFLGRIVDFCQAKAVGKRHGFCINACSTDDIDVFLC